MAEPISTITISALAVLAKSGFSKLLQSEPFQNLGSAVLGGPVEEASGKFAATAYNKLIKSLPKILESPENHDLLRSVRHAYLNATLVMCFARLQNLNPSRFNIKNLGMQFFGDKVPELLRSSDDESNKEIIWLHRAINQLNNQLKNINDWNVTETFEVVTKNVELLLKPENANTQINEIKTKLKAQLVAELVGTADFRTFGNNEYIKGKDNETKRYSECIPEKLLENLNKGWFLLKDDGTILRQSAEEVDYEWFDVMSVFFAEELKSPDSRTSKIFNARMLADLKYQNGQLCNFSTDLFSEKLAESNKILFDQLRSIKNELSELKDEVRQNFNQLVPLLVSFSDVTEIIRSLPDLFKKTLEGIAEVKRILSESVDIKPISLPTIEEVLNYLNEIVSKAEDRPEYYPDHVNFDTIKQRVRIIEKREFEITKKEIQNDENDKDDFKKEKEKIETQTLKSTIEWNDTTNERIKRAVILGDPGFGKSWLLKYEARRIALKEIAKIEDSQAKGQEVNLEEIEIPILKSLSNVAKVYKPESNLKKILAFLASGKDNRTPFYYWIYERLRKEENCTILLDALDETPQDSKKDLVAEIKSIAREPSQLKILLSSRLYGYEGSLLGNENDLQILPFEQSDVISFVNNWFTDEELSKAFLKVIDEHKRIKSLSQNPLMLSLLCKLSESNIGKKDFPKTRTEIYEQCLDGFLTDWQTEKGEKSEYVHRDLDILSIIASELFDKEPFDLETLENELREVIETLKKSIPDIEPNTPTGWINRFKKVGIFVKASENELRFLHLTFQEYLVAREYAKENKWQSKVSQEKVFYDPKCSEVLQLLGGTIENKSEVESYIKTLLKEDRRDMLYRPFQLAVAATIEAGDKINEQLKDKIYRATLALYSNCPKYLESESFLPILRLWRERVIAEMCERVEKYLEIRRPKKSEEPTNRILRIVWQLSNFYNRIVRTIKIDNAKNRAIGATNILEKLNASSELLNILNDERTGFRLIKEGAIPKKYPPKDDYYHWNEFNNKTNYDWFYEICFGLGRLKERKVIPSLLFVQNLSKLQNPEFWRKEQDELSKILTQFYRESKFDGLDENFLHWHWYGLNNLETEIDWEKEASRQAEYIISQLRMKECFFSIDDLKLALRYKKLTPQEITPLLWDITEVYENSGRQLKALLILAELGENRATEKMLKIFEEAALNPYREKTITQEFYKSFYEIFAKLRGKKAKTRVLREWDFRATTDIEDFARFFKGRKDVIPKVLEIMKDPLSNETVRKISAMALGNLQNKESETAMLKLLKKHDSFPNLADGIVWALGEMRVKDSISIIRDVMLAKHKNIGFDLDNSKAKELNKYTFALRQISQEHKIPVLPDSETQKTKFSESRKLLGITPFNFATSNQIGEFLFGLYFVGLAVVGYVSYIDTRPLKDILRDALYGLYELSTGFYTMICGGLLIALVSIFIIIGLIIEFMEKWKLTEEEFSQD